MRELRKKIQDYFISQPSIIGILYLYRFTSWLITSLFYLTFYQGASLGLKLVVIISILIAAKIVTDIYVKHHSNRFVIELTILLETFGIILLLIPTGGIKSPFIWYALNPVLVAACFLSVYFCWLNLSLYMLSSAVISFSFFRHSSTLSGLFYDNLYLMLVFGLITLIVQLLSRLSNKLNSQTAILTVHKEQLEEVNNTLKLTNDKYFHSMEHIMSLYQVIETFHCQTDVDNLPRIFADFAIKLTKAESSFFWRVGDDNTESAVVVFPRHNTKLDETELKEEINNKWGEIISLEQQNIFELTLKGTVFDASLVKTPSQNYGILAVKGICLNDNFHNKKLLVFLSELCGIIIERRHLEGVADNFLIIEEQNRIANEIHDNVSQRLFSIICGIAALTGGKAQKKFNSDIFTQLELIRESCNQAMHELRESIYKLSSRKKGENNFKESVETYLDSFAKLNRLTVDLSINGDEAHIVSTMRNYLYRIIREAAGNAVRHGRCSKLKIEIVISSNETNLTISDNGKGFKVSSQQQRGLGLNNIKNMVEVFGGELKIRSMVGRGTTIYISIPDQKRYDLKENVVL